jgi:hypothetical protein
VFLRFFSALVLCVSLKNRTLTNYYLTNSITDIIIGCIENESLADKCKLPTNRSVMARYLHMRTENSLKPNNDLISLLFGEMEIVWAKSGWCFNHLGMDTVSNI